jgi:hypothetical protein
MLSVCRIHITSNCCRHWLGSRETWRSPQFLWCSLRHVDFVKSKNRPLSSFQCGFGEVHLASFWVVMSKPFFNELAIMMRMTLKWLESLLVSAGMRLTRFVNKFWTTEFPQAVPDLVVACVYLFLDLVRLIHCVALPGKLCSNPFKFQADRKACCTQVPALPQPPQPPVTWINFNHHCP